MFESVEQFWIFMIVINVVAILFDYIRSILFGLCTLASNKKLHDDMVLGIIRSPLTYFDVTPTGQLINKFSNDLGILDHSVNQQMLVLINMLSMLIIIVANLIQIHIIYVLGTLLSILLVIVAANYASDSITGARYLSLQLKTPVFSHLSETISGLTPIHTYNRTNSYMHEFADRQNSSFKGEISLYQC
jgi:ATP-binding cassette subfamily C (CFTR/MRP) protein 1